MSAPNLKEIEWAIHELESQESSESRYTLLAALYTCRNELLGLSTPQPQIASYSEAAGPIIERLGRYGDSDFLRAVEGNDPAKAWIIMDELMETLQVVNRRAYESVMRKLQNI
jgi:hypothetical protein